MLYFCNLTKTFLDLISKNWLKFRLKLILSSGAQDLTRPRYKKPNKNIIKTKKLGN